MTGLTAYDAEFVIYDAATGAVLGYSVFNGTCWDWAMNGVEDCGKFVGNGKYDGSVLHQRLAPRRHVGCR